MFKKLFGKREKKDNRVKVATFIADDVPIALSFGRWLENNSDHKFDIREGEEDHFTIYWVKDHEMDDDLPRVIKLLEGLNSDELRLKCIAKFEVTTKILNTEGRAQ